MTDFPNDLAPNIEPDLDPRQATEATLPAQIRKLVTDGVEGDEQDWLDAALTCLKKAADALDAKDAEIKRVERERQSAEARALLFFKKGKALESAIARVEADLCNDIYTCINCDRIKAAIRGETMDTASTGTTGNLHTVEASTVFFLAGEYTKMAAVTGDAEEAVAQAYCAGFDEACKRANVEITGKEAYSE